MVQDLSNFHTHSLQSSSENPPMPERPADGSVGVPWQLRFLVGGDTPKTISMPVKERIVVGRADSDAIHSLDLDLSPYGGAQNGVSRLHAVISYRDSAMYIEDMGSTNGTRINGFNLTPNRAYRLRSGDEIEFGRVPIVIRFLSA